MSKARGGTVAVAASAALLAVCLAGGPLYISSAASEALQVSLARTCLTDAGIRFHLDEILLPGAPSASELEQALDETAMTIAYAQPPIVTDETTAPIRFAAVGDQGRATTNVVFLSREGQAEHLDATADDLAPGAALVPAWDADAFDAGGSGRFDVTVQPRLVIETDSAGGGSIVPSGEERVVQLTMAGTYADIPTRPEPSFWCGYRDYFRLTAFGDRPRPVAFVDAATAAQLNAVRTWELRPDPRGLTRHEAEQLAHDYVRLASRYAELIGVTEDERYPQIVERLATSQLPTLLSRAELQTEVVARTIAPIRIGGVAAAALLLIASGVMVARQRRRELRLRVLRGVGPVRLATTVARRQLAPVTIGSIAGAVTAFGTVRVWGPTPELEPGPVRDAVVAAGIGLAGAAALVAAITALATARTVDGRPARHHRLIPWEWALVPLTILSYSHLDEAGGVKLVGDDARGGDLLAQSFPIVAIAAGLAVVARPLIFVIRRARLAGHALPVPLLTGVRRITHEPVASGVLVVAVALATGTFMISGTLTTSAEQLLVDKTNTYLGGDMVVRTATLDTVPPGLAGRATPVALVNATIADNSSVDIIGIDPTTFADAVHWRTDASSMSLDDLIASIADNTGRTDTPLRAIVVGDIGDGHVVTKNRDELQVDEVGRARWFPSKNAGADLVVVDVAALRARDLVILPSMWIIDPPADVEQQLASNGSTVLNIRESANVFEVTSFLTVRWSYAVLAAFGVLVGCAALLAQLLTLSARSASRQATWVLARRMGMSPRGEAVALTVELGLPLVAGVALGLGVGWLVATVAVPKLDTIRHLPPPARVVVDLNDVTTALVAGAAVLVLLVVLGMVSILRTRPMEVMRAGN